MDAFATPEGQLTAALPVLSVAPCRLARTSLVSCVCALGLLGCGGSSHASSGGHGGAATTATTTPATTTSLPPRHLVVPETVGSPLPLAEAALARLGLRVTVKTIPDENEPEQDCAANDVVAQLPEPGSEVPPGAVVSLATCALP